MMKKYILIGWIFFILIALYARFFHQSFFQNQLEMAFHFSIYFGYALFLILGSLRGFTLIPVTYLILLGILFFQPLPLFILTLGGILISSVSIYYFSEFLHLDSFFEKKYSKQILQIKSALQKNELPIIIGWSAFPLLPTDLICYVVGTLRINLKKLMLGVLIGEGITSGVYIFFGHQLTQYLHITI
jgi:uncharacterized membrane protein YdjX (TVP38/TMEM64 family)